MVRSQIDAKREREMIREMSVVKIGVWRFALGLAFGTPQRTVLAKKKKYLIVLELELAEQ